MNIEATMDGIFEDRDIPKKDLREYFADNNFKDTDINIIKEDLEEDISIGYYRNENIFMKSIEEISAYQNLEFNWDSYLAEPIKTEIINSANNFISETKRILDSNNLSIDEIVATPLQNGSISQEFIKNDKCLTIIFDNVYENNKLVLLREINDEITEDTEVEFTESNMEKEFLWLAG